MNQKIKEQEKEIVFLYKKEAKREYKERLAHILDTIKYVYYNNNRVTGYRFMRIALKQSFGKQR